MQDIFKTTDASLKVGHNPSADTDTAQVHMHARVHTEIKSFFDTPASLGDVFNTLFSLQPASAH